MFALNLPTFPFKIVEDQGKHKIFDPIRRKYLVLTPEEWVRQHFIQFLISEKGFPKGLFHLEGGVKVHQKTGRYDAIFKNRNGENVLLIECKAPSVKITQETFHQLARYNSRLNVPYLIVTNGLEHYFLKVDFVGNKIKILNDLPHYQYIAS